MGMRMELERLWGLGCTTWLSPRKMPSAKIKTARMMVSAGERGDGRRFESHPPRQPRRRQAPPVRNVLPFEVEMHNSA